MLAATMPARGEGEFQLEDKRNNNKGHGWGV